MADPSEAVSWMTEQEHKYSRLARITMTARAQAAYRTLATHFRQALDELEAARKEVERLREPRYGICPRCGECVVADVEAAEATGDDLPIWEHPDDCDCERCDERNHPEEVWPDETQE